MDVAIGIVTALAAVALVFVTVRLVGSTSALAQVTENLVSAADRANANAARPHLVLSMHNLAPKLFVIRVTNVGLGAALNNDGLLVIRSNDDRQLADDTRVWREPLLEAGAHQDFRPPDIDGQFPDLDTLTMHYGQITLTGTTHDTFGNELQIDAEIREVKMFRDQLADNRRLLVDSPIDRIARSIEKIERKLDS